LFVGQCENTNDCAVTRTELLPGLIALNENSPRSLFIGVVVESLELEQWEPGELRGSRRVLRAAKGAVPSADSPVVAA
ncbi:MAG: hypothetical protein WBD01_15220, partial [Salaquimonas sp.]